MYAPSFKVSIHASSREDATTANIAEDQLISFNPRVLPRGRDISTANSKELLKFQSTRPPARTRPYFLRACCINIVSIHASSREDATVCIDGDGQADRFQSTRPPARTRRAPLSTLTALLVSIHASSREDATSASRLQDVRQRFNPRVLPRGRDIIFIVPV